MSVHPHKTKPDTWIIDYYPAGGKGLRIREVFPGSEADARVYEAEMRKAHMPEMPISPKIIDVIPEWLAFYETNRSPNTFRDVKNSFIKNLTPYFGQLQFCRLTAPRIEEYKRRRIKDGVSKRTINKELAYFSSLIRYAVEHDYAHPLPFKLRGFSGVRSPRPNVPHHSVIKRLLAAAEPEYLGIFLLLYDTGLRLTEALTLTAGRVNLDTGLIVVRGKGNKERIVPITTKRLKKELFAAITRAAERVVKTEDERWLFPNPRTGLPYVDIRKAIARARKKADIKERIYPHLLRHSFGTHALGAGVSMRALQGILGHADMQTTEIYAHLLGEYVTAEARKFGDYVGQGIKRQTTKKKRKKKRKKRTR